VLHGFSNGINDPISGRLSASFRAPAAQGLAGVPVYERGPITRDYETSLRNYYGATAVDVPGDYYKDEIYDDTRLYSTKGDVVNSGDSIPTPRIGDNEVTLPLAADQEIVVRRPGSNEEILIKKTRTGDTEARD